MLGGWVCGCPHSPALLAPGAVALLRPHTDPRLLRCPREIKVRPVRPGLRLIERGRQTVRGDPALGHGEPVPPASPGTLQGAAGLQKRGCGGGWSPASPNQHRRASPRVQGQQYRQHGWRVLGYSPGAEGVRPVGFSDLQKATASPSNTGWVRILTTQEQALCSPTTRQAPPRSPTAQQKPCPCVSKRDCS